MKPTNFTIPMALTILFMMGIWTVDVSTACMINEPYIEGGCVMVNVFNYPVEAVVTYHIGLIMATMGFATCSFWMLFKIEEAEENNYLKIELMEQFKKELLGEK